MIASLTAMGISLAAAIGGGVLVWPSENKINHTYVDPVGIITSCYGHTDPSLKLGMNFTDTQCLDQFAEDLAVADTQVRYEITVPLTAYQEAALVSFVYNAGAGSLHTSTMRKLFNMKNYKGGCDQLTKWVYAHKGGKSIKLPGLEVRRTKEWNVCVGQLELTNVSN